MNSIRRTFARVRSDEAGIGLVEIIIAMMVFMIIATSVAYTMIAVIRNTAISQDREQASNLAAQEIDLDRSITDLFDLTDADKDVVIGSTTYHIHRSASWYSNASVQQNCGSGGGLLQYKQIIVSVTWSGMLDTTKPVVARTLIDPGTRLNDPALGTILVSVINSSGTASSGVTVTATPSAVPNGAATPTTAPDPTDSQGCTYILQVSPGNYDVKITKTGYLGVDQSSTSTQTVGVTAGAARSVGFEFDAAGSFPLNWAGNVSGSPLVPSNLETTFIAASFTSAISAPTTPVARYPFQGGYQIIAGRYVDATTPTLVCQSVDPQQWLAGTNSLGVAQKAGVRQAAVASVPGGSAPTTIVNMGVVNLKSLSGNPYVSATRVNGASNTGDPGCSALADTTGFVSVYKFGKITSGTANIALPFGSWIISTSPSSTGALTALAPAQLTMVTNGTVGLAGGVTFDPRVPGP